MGRGVLEGCGWRGGWKGGRLGGCGMSDVRRALEWHVIGRRASFGGISGYPGNVLIYSNIRISHILFL